MHVHMLITRRALFLCTTQVYDFSAWTKHRSTDRYVKNLESMPTSRILLALSGPLLVISTVAISICSYETLLADGELPAYLPK